MNSTKIATAALLVGLSVSFVACGGGGTSKPTQIHLTVTPIVTTVVQSTMTALQTATSATPAVDYQAGFHSVFFVDDQTGWVGGHVAGGLGGLILATTDGGRTWHKQFSGPRTIIQLAFVSPLVGWALTDVDGNTGQAELVGTSDRGQHWQALANLTWPRSLAFVTPKLGRVVVGGGDPQNGQLMETVDGGHAWNPVASSSRFSSACFSDADRGWATAGRDILQTSDGGRTWTATFSYADLGAGTVSCGAGDVAYATFLGECGGAGNFCYAAFRTLDGRRWEPVLAYGHPELPVQDLGPSPGAIHIVDASIAYDVAGCGPCEGVGIVTVLQTHDAGKTWASTGSISGLNYGTVAFPDATHWWAAGTHIDAVAPFKRYPVILATTDGGKTWTRQYP